MQVKRMEGVTITVENGQIVVRLSDDRAEQLAAALSCNKQLIEPYQTLNDHLLDKLADAQMQLMGEI